MAFQNVTDPYGALALVVFFSATPIAASGWMLRALSTLRRV